MSLRGAAGDPGPSLGTPTTEQVLHLSRLPTPNTTTLLIVGLDSSPCEPISRSLLGRAPRGQLQIRRTSTLPLPKDATRPRVDFVLFAAELASPHSVHMLRQALRHVQVPFFLGKSCLLLLNTATSKSRVDLEDVLRLGDAYNLPQFKVNIDNEREVEVFADQLLKMTQTAAGLVPQINTLLLETTKQTYQWDNNAL